MHNFPHTEITTEHQSTGTVFRRVPS